MVDVSEITDARVDEVSGRLVEQAIAGEQESIRQALERPIDPCELAVVRGLEAIGRITGEKVCTDNVVVYQSPQAALFATSQSTTDGIGCGVIDACYRDLGGSELLGEEPNEDTVAVLEFAHRVYDTILFDEQSVLISWPHVVHRDENEELHCATGPAIVFGSGDQYQAEYYWHGQEIDRDVIESPNEVTREYLLGLSAEKRRATYEALSHEKAIDVLEAGLADSEVLNGLEYGLYKSQDSAWLRMQSPPLKDGTQPFYVEPVHEDCTSCAEALAWRATGELDSSVRYEFES